MRFKTYMGAKGGIDTAIGALVSGPEIGRRAYNDTMRNHAYVDHAQAGARKADSEAALNKQRFDARNSIAGALQGVPLPPGLTPGVVSSMFVGSENPDLRDYTQGMVDMGGTQAQGLALDAAQRGDTSAMNRFNTITKPGETYEPFAMTEAGVIDQGTGAYTVSDLARAREGQANAAAANSMAGARANDALAAQRGFMEVSPGGSVVRTPKTVGEAMESVYQAPYSPSQRGAGGAGGRPTSNALQQQELEAQGIPSPIARGIAYGSIKNIPGEMGRPRVMQDVATGVTIATIDDDGRMVLTPEGQRMYGGRGALTPAPGGAPMPGAKQAPDGNWYIQQNGQWFRVDP